MGKPAPSALIGEIRNKVGDTVYYQSFRRTFTRTRINPTNTATTARTRVRAFVTQIAAAWQRTLTPSQRASWRTAALTAAQNPQRNDRGTRTGWQYFHQVNLVLLNIGASIITDPPAAQQQDPLTSLSVDTLDASTQTLKLAFTGATGSNTHIIVYATGPRNAVQLSANGTTRFIQSFPPGTTGTVDISTAWTTKYGTLSSGNRVVFQACTANALDGRLTPRLYATSSATGEVDAMQLIQTVTLAADAASIEFAAIPGTYTHLMLIGSLRTAGTGVNHTEELNIRVNSDNGNNYDWTRNITGGFGLNQYLSDQSSIELGNFPDATADAYRYGSMQAFLANYANTAMHKTIQTHAYPDPYSADASRQWIQQSFGTWRNTAAITDLAIYPNTAMNLAAGSTLSLYGIS